MKKWKLKILKRIRRVIDWNRHNFGAMDAKKNFLKFELVKVVKFHVLIAKIISQKKFKMKKITRKAFLINKTSNNLLRCNNSNANNSQIDSKILKTFLTKCNIKDKALIIKIKDRILDPEAISNRILALFRQSHKLYQTVRSWHRLLDLINLSTISMAIKTSKICKSTPTNNNNNNHIINNKTKALDRTFLISHHTKVHLKHNLETKLAIKTKIKIIIRNKITSKCLKTYSKTFSINQD